MQLSRRLAAPLLVAALLAAGCGEVIPADAGPAIEIGGTDTMRFEPETITVKAGQPVLIAFKNKGVIVHDYISSGAEKNIRLANVLGGRTAQGIFQASKPGTYTVLCVQPGHKEAGMVGKIVVEYTDVYSTTATYATSTLRVAARIALGAALFVDEGCVAALGAEIGFASGQCVLGRGCDGGSRGGHGDGGRWEVDAGGVDFHAPEELGQALGDGVRE